MFVEVSEGFVGDIGAEFKYNARLCEELKEKFSKEEGNFTPDDMMMYLKKTNLTSHIKTMLSLIPEGKETEFKEAICSAAERRKLPPVNYRKMLEIAHKGGFAEEFERVHALDKVINDKPRKTKTLFVKSTEELENTPNLSEYTTIVCDFEDKKELMPMVIPGNNVFIAKSNNDLQANPDLSEYDAVICDFEGETEFADLTKLPKKMIIKGDIDWGGRDFDKLPDISESIVCGRFDCSYCENIKSLKGAPKYVGGEFHCEGCKNLTSLKGAPKVVGGDFYCHIGGGHIDMTEYITPINSLDGVPKKIGGILDCRKTPLQTQSQNSGIYIIDDGKCYDIFNLPKDKEFVINGRLMMNYGGMEELPDLSNVIIKGDFECQRNSLKSAKGWPKSVEGISTYDDYMSQLIAEELIRRKEERSRQEKQKNTMPINKFLGRFFGKKR